jgi:hypothetical protein
MSRVAILLAAIIPLAGVAVAETPYAGMQSRPIKALSDQQIADLGAGRGMGLALAAQLNGYPGPVHVLELADKLELSADQRAQVQGLFDAMKAEALPLGSRLIAQESELDRQFASRTVTPASLKAATETIAATQGIAPRNTSQIPSLDSLDIDARSDAPLRRAARLRRDTDASSSLSIGGARARPCRHKSLAEQ